MEKGKKIHKWNVNSHFLLEGGKKKKITEGEKQSRELLSFNTRITMSNEHDS